MEHRNGFLENVRKKAPLVHNITNYVTVNDCANILLACGASPIMADDIREVEDITSICSALVINIGTLNERTVEAMIKAGKKANELRHTVILDPVGAGASAFRTETAARLLKELSFTAIRGNISEIKTISRGFGSTKGVDADAADRITAGNLNEAAVFAGELARETKAVIIITGPIDLITDGHKAYAVRNGHPVMSRITGTGCMLTAVTGAFLAANPEKLTEAAASAVCTMGICGELAYEKMTETEGGTASFRMHLIDFVSKIQEETITSRARLSEIPICRKGGYNESK